MRALWLFAVGTTSAASAQVVQLRPPAFSTSTSGFVQIPGTAVTLPGGDRDAGLLTLVFWKMLGLALLGGRRRRGVRSRA